MSSQTRGAFGSSGRKAGVTKYYLKTAVGVDVCATLDISNFNWTPTLNPPPPYSPDLTEKFLREYEPWRNEIIEKAVKRLGVRIRVIFPKGQ